jgi:hypothetical protein
MQATVGTAVPLFGLREARYGYLPPAMLHKVVRVVVPSEAVPFQQGPAITKKKVHMGLSWR